MGGGASKSAYQVNRKFKRSDMEVVQLMMPVYYVIIPVLEEDIHIAKEAWKHVLDDTSPAYLAKKEDFKVKALASQDAEEIPSSCMMWFYDTFYKRLFDVHPTCRSMFTGGLKTQGKFLVKLLSLALSLLNDTSKFNETLIKLAEAHCIRGVKAIEYGIVGEVLFYTLKTVLGDTYSEDVHLAWVKVFSRMLKVMVPVAVAYEMKIGAEKNENIPTETSEA